MNHLVVSEGALGKGAQSVGKSRDAMTSELISLGRDLELASTRWQGQGAAAFTSIMSSWANEMGSVVSSLSEFEENLTTSQKTFTVSDEDQAAMMVSMKARLG